MAFVKDYSEQIRGVSYKPEDVHDELDDDSIPLLRANNISDGILNFDDLVYVSSSKVKDTQKLKAGDILICASSGSKNLVGKAAYVPNDLEMTFGAFCKVVRPKGIEAAFFQHFFQSPSYRQRISDLAAGANINNIRNEHIDEMQFPLPDLPTQRRIAATLDKVSEGIAVCRQMLADLDVMVKTRFVEMFGDPVTNPHNLPTATLGELSELITKGASPSWQGFSYTEDCSQTLFVTSENVREGYIDLSSPKYIEDGFNEKQKRSIIHKGDFLINIVGASIGRAAQFNFDCKANMNQAAALVRVKDDRIRDKYLLIYLNSDKALIMYDSMKSDTGRANLSLQDISDLSILLPSVEQQIEFERIVEQLDKSKVVVQQQLAELETLKKSLMQEYFG